MVHKQLQTARDSGLAKKHRDQLRERRRGEKNYIVVSTVYLNLHLGLKKAFPLFLSLGEKHKQINVIFKYVIIYIYMRKTQKNQHSIASKYIKQTNRLVLKWSHFCFVGRQRVFALAHNTIFHC